MAISIHPPRVGWDVATSFGAMLGMAFQSTHPVWGGTRGQVRSRKPVFISIHPPRVGWDLYFCRSFPRFRISIHPPRVGWDHRIKRVLHGFCISIHPPRVGWDFQKVIGMDTLSNFNPPTPCGVGQQTKVVIPPNKRFQSTHPVWGGT